MIKTYSELCQYSSYDDRFSYVKLSAKVGADTFGFDRVFNQMFYKSREWRSIRDYVITRDMGRDLGCEGYDIIGEPIIVHHMNPIRLDDIKNATDILLNPEYLISVRDSTHKLIHYGVQNNQLPVCIERTKNDTCPWKKV